MKKLLQEFKEFAFSGNLITLAVAFIMAGAFGLLVKSLVDNVVLQLVAAIVGKPDFSDVGFNLGDARIGIGAFFTELVAFVSIAMVMFVLVKAYKAFEAQRTGPDAMAIETKDAEGPSPEVALLTEIRDALRTR
jgi:large conductance mechanosensitive channel